MGTFLISFSNPIKAHERPASRTGGSSAAAGASTARQPQQQQQQRAGGSFTGMGGRNGMQGSKGQSTVGGPTIIPAAAVMVSCVWQTMLVAVQVLGVSCLCCACQSIAQPINQPLLLAHSRSAAGCGRHAHHPARRGCEAAAAARAATTIHQAGCPAGLFCCAAAAAAGCAAGGGDAAGSGAEPAHDAAAGHDATAGGHAGGCGGSPG